MYKDGVVNEWGVKLESVGRTVGCSVGRMTVERGAVIGCRNCD